MTLATHIVVAGAVASPFLPNPLVGFLAGFLSHYVVDAIPHWDWPLKSIRINLQGRKYKTNFSSGTIIFDTMMMLSDMALGFLALFLVLQGNFSINAAVALFAAAVGGVLPGGMDIFFLAFRKEPFVTHHRFHSWAHTRRIIPHRETLKGIFMQLPVVAIPLGFLMFIFFR